jgi:hypothetical protein
MLYLGYNTAYVQENYNQMVSENGGAENQWQDTIGKFQALYDADAASAKFSDSWSFDSANSKTAVYHWLYDFKGLGAIDTSVRADSPSFGVFDKQGTKTYVCYNPSASSSTVTFYQGNSAVGTVEAPPRSMVTTGDFSQVITDVFFDPAAQNSTSVLVDSMTDTLVYFSTAGWSVSLSLPTGTFREQVLLSISTGVVPSSLPETQQPTAIAFGIATDKDLQPLKDIALTVAYQDSAVAGCDESKLFISRYDTASAAWLPLSSIVNAAANSVSAAINHLSRFAVLQFAPASSVQRSTVYPNPYRPGSGTAFDRPGGIVFANLALRSQIKIFTLSGELVFETEENDGDGRLEWAAVNHSGEKLASGIYLYIVTGAGGEKKTGKIAIIK